MNPYFIETERLKLRKLTNDDFENLFAIWGNAEAMRFYPYVLTREQMTLWMERIFKRDETHGVTLWAVERRSDGLFVGECGLLMQDIFGTLETEVSYHFNPQFWGQGYATEAARGCMKYAFEQLGRTRVISLIRPENTPSRRVAERNGLAVEQEIDWHGYKHFIYAASVLPKPKADL